MVNQPTMTAARFYEIIDKLGFTQRGASHFLGVTERTTARWIARDQIARPVAMVLELPESGIAPTIQDAAVQNVLQQAEALSAEWAA
jgi:hypothetical protein